MLNGFLAELDSRKTTIENTKSNLETIYAKMLGKPEKEIMDNQALMEEIHKTIAAVDASFTSFNGTVKSIKQSIDTQLNWNGMLYTYVYYIKYIYIKILYYIFIYIYILYKRERDDMHTAANSIWGTLPSRSLP